MKLWLVLVAGWLFAAAPAHAEKRVALVIGNSAYQNIARLDNPRNHATLMAQTLQGLGFQLIGNGPQIDLDKAGFDTALQKFGNAVVGAEGFRHRQKIDSREIWEAYLQNHHTVSPDMRTIYGRWAIKSTRGDFIMSR